MEFDLTSRLEEIQSERIDKDEAADKAQSDKISTSVFKLIIIGDSSVGKSSILNQLMTGEFREQHNITVGTDFGEFNLLLNYVNMIRVQIWDTAGQEQFRAITRGFYRDSHAVIIVYDIRNEQSFEHVRDWVREIRENTDDSEKLIKYLVGNFADKNDERKITTEEGKEAVKEYELQQFYETSAFTGSNIVELFTNITKHLYLDNEQKLDNYVSSSLL